MIEFLQSAGELLLKGLLILLAIVIAGLVLWFLERFLDAFFKGKL